MRKILLLGTGGTISCAQSENGLSPEIGINEILERVRGGCGEILDVQIECCQVFWLDSTDLTHKHWERLAQIIRSRYDEFDGFVITHGTDTLAYAAACLSCLIQNSRKPIVITGSMLPITDEDSDAPINLRDALKFAADERAFGVRVVFDGGIIDGRCAHKYETSDIDAFDSVNNDEIGFFNTDGKIYFYEEYSGKTRFYERLSDEVYVYKLIPGQPLCVPRDVKALILESYGAGGIPDYLLGDVNMLADAGVYIIIATQCAYGGTDAAKYAVGNVDFPLLEAGLYTVEYAAARARWALSYSNDFDEFKKLFR